MSDAPARTPPAARGGFALLAIGGATVAVVAATSQNWLTTVGGLLSATSMAAFFWITRSRR